MNRANHFADCMAECLVVGALGKLKKAFGADEDGFSSQICLVAGHAKMPSTCQHSLSSDHALGLCYALSSQRLACRGAVIWSVCEANGQCLGGLGLRRCARTMTEVSISSSRKRRSSSSRKRRSSSSRKRRSSSSRKRRSSSSKSRRRSSSSKSRRRSSSSSSRRTGRSHVPFEKATGGGVAVRAAGAADVGRGG